jgi:hypothetical protein
LKVGTKESYKIVSQSRDISDDGHGLPAAGMRVEAQSELPSAQRGGPSDRDALVHADGRMPPSRPDRHVPIVAEGVDRPTQDVGVVRGRPESMRSLVRCHGTSSHAASAAGRSAPACNG